MYHVENPDEYKADPNVKMELKEVGPYALVPPISFQPILNPGLIVAPTCLFTALLRIAATTTSTAFGRLLWEFFGGYGARTPLEAHMAIVSPFCTHFCAPLDLAGFDRTRSGTTAPSALGRLASTRFGALKSSRANLTPAKRPKSVV
jgi:hypothetical protein